MANLPADLPTNWTQGQIISPNGTEVGLTEQYGYNYLNEQVNNTQTEVNSLGTAQTNTQQQVNTLNTQVGNIQGQVTTQGQEITALQETTTSQGQSISTLQSNISTINSELSTKAERYIYNSTLNTTWSGSAAPYTQTINISGILSTDTPHITPVYGSNIEDESQAWSLVTRATTANGSITFYCYGDKPTIQLNLQIEVIR